MSKISLEQKVKLFKDEKILGKQEVFIDTADNWIVLNHDGQELSMRMENWEKLNELVTKAQTEIKQHGSR